MRAEKRRGGWWRILDRERQRQRGMVEEGLESKGPVPAGQMPYYWRKIRVVVVDPDEGCVGKWRANGRSKQQRRGEGREVVKDRSRCRCMWVGSKQTGARSTRWALAKQYKKSVGRKWDA